jgi:hypothetical protein
MRSTGTGTRAGVLSLLIFMLTGGCSTATASPISPDWLPPQKKIDCFAAGHVIVDGVRYLLLVCDGGALVYFPVGSRGSGFPESEAKR